MSLTENEKITDINLGLKLIESEDGFLFGTDALLLSAFVRIHKNSVAADFGSGPGAVSLLCAASGKFSKIYAVEIQKQYADLCKRNVALNGMEEKIEVLNSDVRLLKQRFDVVVSNPPYMKINSGKLNYDRGKMAARHEINGDIYEFCKAVSSVIEYGGAFYVVYRPDRLTELIGAMRENKLEPKKMCMVHSDTEHAPCLVLIEAKMGAKPFLDVLPPLFLNDGNGNMTDRAKNIYDTMSWS